jgi:hypothetical protein
MAQDDDEGKARRQRRVVLGRQRSVHVRVSDAQRRELLERAGRAGVSAPKFLLDNALSDGPGIVERRAAIAMFLSLRRQLIGVATNINQMAKVANATGRIPVGWADALSTVTAMETAVVEAIRAIDMDVPV